MSTRETKSGNRERLRVIQVVLSLVPGGTERLVIEITKRLQPVADVAVACLDQDGAWAAELTDLGIPVTVLHRKPGFQPVVGRALARLARERGARVLHCHQYSPFIYGSLARLFAPGLRVAYTEHGRLDDAPPSRKRTLANAAFGLVPGWTGAVSGDLRRHMLAEGFRPDRVTVLYNGIDPGPPPAADGRAVVRAELGLPPSAVVVGTVARLDPVKDLGTLLDAVAQLRRSQPEARLVVVGDGAERTALEARAARPDLAGAVLFTGTRRDARRLLSAFDVYANTSIHEGVSLTILEAMAAGLPVVATTAGGNPEVVADGETGMLVPVRAPDAVASALSALAAARERAQRFGARGRARVEERFSMDRMVSEYVDVYRGLLRS
jgi:glycosyltransferase involved in cell wall biosynthesis